jgi:nucleoside-diphosphate-sugar epimerase
MRFDLSTNTLAAYAIASKKLTVWGGAQKRPQIHLDDATDFMIKLIDVPAALIGGRIFNAAGHNTTVQEIAETIGDVLNGELELTSGPARADERSYHVSSERIEKELGFGMKKTIRDAIVDIMNAYQAGRWTNPDDAIYHNIRQMKATRSVAG